jgi:hypothetical protein
MNVASSAESQSLAHEGAKEVATWVNAKGLDVGVWTALPSNFAEKLKTRFSLQAAVGYLTALPPPAKVKAVEYIWRTPEFVRTPLRSAMEQDRWFHEQAVNQELAHPGNTPRPDLWQRVGANDK